jgi:Flp pilus assembly protein TadG
MIFHPHNQFMKSPMLALVSLRTCSAGAVAVVTAMVLPILLGFTSLGTEVGHWYLAQREMQGAADAAAISAASQWIADQIAGNTSSTTYQTVGQNYASYNGFTIPTSNVCLVTVSGDNCDSVRSLDSRPIICSAPPCIVVEITQSTAQWLTTVRSLEPVGNLLGRVQSIPAPTLKTRAIVSVVLTLTANQSQGNSCILALANARNAIQVRGNGDIHANCGLLIDGGRTQNARTPNINSDPLCSDGTTPPCGGLTLSGANANVHISSLTVAASTAGPSGSSCPDASRCFLYNPATSSLTTGNIFTNVETGDPFAGRTFTKPTGVVVTANTATSNEGSGYIKNTTRTFTVVGGTSTAPAKFTATVNNSGQVTGTPTLTDPGQYTTLPPNPVSVTADDGKGSGATFTLTTANCLPSATASALPNFVPGRAYCAINVSVGAKGSLTFPSGIYYIEGGEWSPTNTGGCVGLCIGAGTYNATNVTFVLTNIAGGSIYAQYAFAGNNSINFTAPPNNINDDGSACTTTICPNTTWGMIIFQDRNAPNTTALSSGGTATSSNANAGSTLNSMSGCGNNTCRTLSGSIYVPNQTANFSGNGQVNGTCFGVVSKYLDDAGVPIFQNGCLPGTTGGSGGTGAVTGGTLKLAQ